MASVTEPTSHPAFHYMRKLDYREYYITSTGDDLIRDINNHHNALWPALLTLFRNHSTWGTAAIIEGWALRPELVAQLSGNISGLFLLADEALLEQRIRSSGFSRGASDPEKMIQRYLERTLWYNDLIRDQAAGLGLISIPITSAMQPAEITDECMRVLAAKEGKT